MSSLPCIEDEEELLRRKLRSSEARGTEGTPAVFAFLAGEESDKIILPIFCEAQEDDVSQNSLNVWLSAKP